jgi:hypothetical protein
MTTTAEQTDAEKKAALAARTAEMAAREVKLNAGKTGKGTRTSLGLTRGRNPQEIQYENWDETQPETLPTSFTEFMHLTGGDKLSEAEGEAFVVRRLILGDNEILYKEASDPIAEFVDKTWPEEIQKMFKAVVKNYSGSANVSIEDAVALIKPGIVASQASPGRK